MKPELQDTGKAILREISPARRFFRQWAFYLLIIVTGVACVSSPQAWPYYALIFLAGTNLLFLSVYAEELLNKWPKISEN